MRLTGPTSIMRCDVGPARSDPARLTRQTRPGDLNPSIRHLRTSNSVYLASTRVFIRVVIPGLTVSRKDWIDEGRYTTCRGRCKLW